VEGRMTVCNMAIEAGARAGFVGVDEKTTAYVKGRPYAPQGALWDQAVAYWRTLRSDDGAVFDRVVRLDATEIQPQVTWGTSPEMVVPVDAVVPDPGLEGDPSRPTACAGARVHGVEAGTPIQEIRIDKVFIGSCTNSRIEDLRAAAAVAKGRTVAPSVKLAMVVPGSGLVKQQGRGGGALDRIFNRGRVSSGASPGARCAWR